MSSGRLRRRREKVNYAENGGCHDDNVSVDNEDFMTNNFQKKRQKKPPQKKTSGKSTNDEKANIESSIPIQKSFTTNSFGFGKCPNLSEDESSDDDDDNVPIIKLKALQKQEQELLSTDPSCESEETTGKRKATLSLNSSSTPLKKVKMEITEGTEGMECGGSRNIEYFDEIEDKLKDEEASSEESSEDEWQEVDGKLHFDWFIFTVILF